MMSKNTRLGLCTLVVLYLLMEGLSFGLYALLHGEAFTFSAIERHQTEVLGAGDGQIKQAVAIPSNITIWGGSSFVLHPYEGWVRDPEIKPAKELGNIVTENGFLAEQDPLAASADGTIAIVGLTGASAAGRLFDDQPARAILHEYLAKMPAFKDKKIIIAMFCTGGYKEPQQLMTIAYYLAQGGRLDLLINLDGKNEATDGYTLAQQGTYPLYPTLWKNFFPAAAEPGNLNALGEVVLWRKLREFTGRGFRHLRYSVTASTLWTLIDHFMDVRINAAAVALTEPHGKTTPYFIAGPQSMQNAAPDALAAFLVRTWRDSSLQIHHLAQSNHFRYAHFLQPNPYVPDGKPLSSVEKAQFYDPASVHATTVAAVYPGMEAAIGELRSQGVSAYSLTHVFEHNANTLYIDACCHVNAEGNAMLARAIGERLLQQ